MERNEEEPGQFTLHRARFFRHAACSDPKATTHQSIYLQAATPLLD